VAAERTEYVSAASAPVAAATPTEMKMINIYVL
jgi:hypothetical protein